jgi:hypothetical protein
MNTMADIRPEAMGFAERRKAISDIRKIPCAMLIINRDVQNMRAVYKGKF